MIDLKRESLLAIIQRIREKTKKQDYEFTIPHFFEEMANDNLTFADVEMAIAKGRINRKFTRDPRGTRYEVIGPATDGRIIGIICRIKSTGKLLFITTYALEETK
jgi:hypothetical protein